MASDGEISCTNDPNFAVIYSFLKVFGKLYSLDVPSIVNLQELIENTQEVLEPLKELHLRLLRRALKSVQSNKWERALIKFCHQQGYHQEAWELERFSYKKASTLVKLKILKLLLEYQFTCHPKFKSAVNAISCKELRIDPVGTDKNGCVYWLQVDDDANLCLYKEDQDEETWQLIARNREELAKVIDQLKKGEEISPSTASIANEDTNSEEINMQKEIPENKKSEPEDDNDEEFLSPESESDPENDDIKTDNAATVDSDNKDTKTIDESQISEVEHENNDEKVAVLGEDPEGNAYDDVLEDQEGQGSQRDESKPNDVTQNLSEDIAKIQSPEFNVEKNETEKDIVECENKGVINMSESEESVPKDEDFGEAIEEPVMIITGEGNGADCESSFFLSEEISEPVMYIYGEGFGYDDDTGNPDIIEQDNNVIENTEEIEEECVNGEVHEISSQVAKTRSGKSVKLRTSLAAVTRRVLKKQSNDSSVSPKSDPKKHCIRDLGIDKSSTSNSDVNSKQTETSSTASNKNNVKKSRSKIKKKVLHKRNQQSNEESNSIDKTSIIEKRKSSVSSIEQDDRECVEAEKEKSPDKEAKVEDILPPKKLRLETSPGSDVEISSHSNDVDKIDIVNNEELDKETINNGIKSVENEVILNRKKIVPVKGKHKKIKKALINEDIELHDVSNDDSSKKANKSLKRTIMDATMSDKNKSESPTESDAEEEVTSGKRLKIKPKKIIISTRKKVEAKLQEKNSSDESEEETLYSLAGKKGAKKTLKKKPKIKEKVKPKMKQTPSDESDLAPVRQSRRIAQLKIKEEAERRNMEEVALRELKKIHKKKNHDDEEEWKASGASSSEVEVSARKKLTTWRHRSVSTGPEPDSESDEPIFEHEEPDLDFSKSDHEFSPESDLESGEPVLPTKLARTLQEGAKDDGFCKRCGSGEQPEWILLCDCCDDGYHASCLKPMLFLVPEGDWFCPPCNHIKLIGALEKELVKIDELAAIVEAEKARKLIEEPPKIEEKEKTEEKSEGEESASGSDWSSTSDEGAVYRLRARKQLPVSYRSQEYDRLISSAIKEEYVEPTSSAGNQGRGKDISTIMEAAEEEKLKAEREALEQGKPIEKKMKKRQRRKPRKLNSLDVPSEDDDETDEDFKDTGMESSSESISTSAERDSSSATNSSDDLPIRRACRSENKGERSKMTESSPEVKKKKKVFDSSSDSGDKDKDWTKKSKSKKKSSKKRDKSSRKSRKRSGLMQYDADGNVIRARVTYGGLSGDDDINDWSPKHRTRQKKINYMEMPNTESEDEMHKSSGKHMPDSSDEFKITSDSTTDSDSDRVKKKKAEEEQSSEEKKKALSDLIKKTAVVPLEKLPDDVTKAKTEELQAHLLAASQSSSPHKPSRGKGSRGGRGNRGAGRGRGGRTCATPVAPPPDPDDELAKLVGVKIKDLRQDDAITPLQAERERKRQEREVKLAEKEAKRLERLQKKEEKEKLKEQKAKEREEKKLARIALQESKRVKKESPQMGYAIPVRPMSQDAAIRGVFPNPIPIRHPGEFQERFPAVPRLQVRAELRGVLTSEDRLLHRPEHVMREGTLSVAGSPQPFKPVSEEPSIITRMPHMLNQQYRGQMYANNSPYGTRTPQNMMYSMHHMNQNMSGRPQYPPQGYYPHMRGLPPGYPAQQAMRPTGPNPSTSPLPPGSHGPAGPSGLSPHGQPMPGMMHRQLGPPGSHRPAVSSPLALPPPLPHMAYPPAAPHLAPSPHTAPHLAPSPHAAPHLAPSPHGAPHLASSPHGAPAPRPLAPPPPSPLKPPTPSAPDLPIQIKAEVKTEPEYHSPPTSPPQRPPSPKQEPVRNHPKIKHTESKDRKPRFPLGPYAPQYGPYGPYAPPQTQPEHAPLLARMPLQQPSAQRMPLGPHQYLQPGLEDKPEQSRSPIQRMLQMERAHMERSPYHSMERPPHPMSERHLPHMAERPPHMVERPPHMAERSPHMAERPLHMAERPPHMAERPPHMAERPPHMAERPPHMVDRPPHMAERSPHMAERPPHMAERSPHMAERPPHMADRPPHMLERPPHMTERPTHMSERPPQLSERSPQMSERLHQLAERTPQMSERPPQMSERLPQISERSPQMSERPHHMAERPPHMSECSPHISERPPHTSERPPHLSERPPHHMLDRPPHPSAESAPRHVPVRPPHAPDRPLHHPHVERPAHMLADRAHHPSLDRQPHHMSERPPHASPDRPPHPSLDRGPHQLSERPMHSLSGRSPHEYLPSDRHSQPLSDRAPHPMSDRLQNLSSERSPHLLSEHQLRPLPEFSPQHLSDRTPHHLSDRPHSLSDRPPHLISERPPHSSSGQLPPGMTERSPHRLGPDMTRLPPHYLPHLQQQLRPQYGTPMMRHPGRSSPGSMLPHYTQHFQEMHKPPMEKHINPAIPQAAKPLSPRPPQAASELALNEPNGQTVLQIKKENIDNDQPPSPRTSEASQPLDKLQHHVNRTLENEPLKQLQEIKTEEKDEDDPVTEPPPREEGSVFGGLVSYFSSQQEDDIDA